MTSKELSRSAVLSSFSQKVARIAHLLKARFRFKEQPKIEWLSNFIDQGSTILDIGANFGVFAKSFACIHKGSCQIQAFEPVSYNFGILQQVAAPFHNISIHNFALSENAGTADIFIPVKEKGRIGPALAHLGQETNRSYFKETIKTVKLDDFIAQQKIDKISFIKCDVEGAELLVFRGAVETLKRFKPTIFTEIDGSYTRRMNYEPAELVDFLIGIGYQAHYVIKANGSFSLEPVSGYTRAGDYLFKKTID
jgi:FkbM family methyltransferase